MPTTAAARKCAILSVKVTKLASSPPLRRSSSRRARHFATRLRKERPTFALSSHGDSAFSQIGSSRSRREAPPRPQLREPLGETSAVPSRHRPAASPRSQRLPEPTPPSPTHTADETGRKHAPLHAFVGHFVSARHFLSPFAAHGRTIPRCPAAFNAFHHVHSPPLIVFFRRRPLRFRTRRCPCGRTCAVFYQNRCTFFQ